MVVAAKTLRPQLNDDGECGRPACLDRRWLPKQHWRQRHERVPWPVRRTRQQGPQLMKQPWQQPQRLHQHQELW